MWAPKELYRFGGDPKNHSRQFRWASDRSKRDVPRSRPKTRLGAHFGRPVHALTTSHMWLITQNVGQARGTSSWWLTRGCYICLPGGFYGHWGYSYWVASIVTHIDVD